MNEWMDRWNNEWMDGWMDRLTDGWMDRWINQWKQNVVFAACLSHILRVAKALVSFKHSPYFYD